MSHPYAVRGSAVLAVLLSGGLGLFPGLTGSDAFRVSRGRGARSVRLDTHGADPGLEAGDSGHFDTSDYHSALTLQSRLADIPGAAAPLAAEVVSPVSFAPEFTTAELVQEEAPGLPRASGRNHSARAPPSDSLL